MHLLFKNPIKANSTLKICQGVHFSTPKCCSTLIFGKPQFTMHLNLKKQNKNKDKKLHQKVENMKQEFLIILD